MESGGHSVIVALTLMMLGLYVLNWDIKEVWINFCSKIYYHSICLGGSAYTGQFPNAANDVLLTTSITCSNTATTLSECTFSHFTKTSTCDAKRIAAIKCHSEFVKLKI